VRFLRDLRHLLRGRDFRRLFAVRIVSQLGDGVFQVALASYILFSPERLPTPGAIAGAFAAVLLPFSILGPFTGVLLDRWSRRQVLAWEKGDLFPTKPFIDKMEQLRKRGAAAIPKKARGDAPMKVLADPALWELVRKIVAHKKLRDEVTKLASGYADPKDDA